MSDSVFPQTPAPPFAFPQPVELVVPRRPLVPIFQALGISIHDVVNDSHHRGRVRAFYRITRRIENEGWLQRREEERAYEAWLNAHL